MNPDQLKEYLDLKKLISWVLGSLILLTVLTIATGIISDSLAMDAIAVDCGASLVLHLFSLITVNIILRQNRFSFPYGTGKLENFSGFLFAMIALPGALLILAIAVKRFLHPTVTVDFGLPQAMLVLWVIRDLTLFVCSFRICKRHQNCSPMTQSYLVITKYNLISGVAILAGLLLGTWMLATGRPYGANIVDLLIAVMIASYLGYCAAGLLIRNFRSLLDLPLPETDQLAILNALVADFDAYEGIGNVYSQLSGNTRLIQIELHVKPSTTAEEIELLRNRIEQRLRGQFSKLLFHLIPLVKRSDGYNCQD